MALVLRVLQRAPEDALAHFRLGNLYLDQGDLAGAEREYTTATELQPHYASALNNLAIVYRRQHRTRLFVATYKKAQRANLRSLGHNGSGVDSVSVRRRIWGTALLILLIAAAALVAWQMSRVQGAHAGEAARSTGATAAAGATCRPLSRGAEGNLDTRAQVLSFGDTSRFLDSAFV